MKVKGENLLITATWFSLVSFSKGKSWKVHHREWCTPESQPSPGASFEQDFTWEEGEEKGKGTWCFPHLPMPLILSSANLETSVGVVSRGPFTSTATSLRGKVNWLPVSSVSLISQSRVWHKVDATPALSRFSLILQGLWWHRHLQLPWRSDSMVVFFSRGAHMDLVTETFTVTCLIIFCTEILSDMWHAFHPQSLWDSVVLLNEISGLTFLCFWCKLIIMGGLQSGKFASLFCPHWDDMKAGLVMSMLLGCQLWSARVRNI